MRWKHWVLFGVIQCTGFTLISLDRGPCAGILALPGLLALLPGSLITFASPHVLDDLPQWAAYILGGVIIVCTNALAWYLVVRIDERKAKTVSGTPGSPPRGHS